MRGVFEERELQPAEPRHDTELTLGSTTLLLIFFGLVLLCGLCFGLGYATGHHGTPETAVMQPAANPQAASQAEGDRPKPVADQPAPVSDSPVESADDQSSSALEASAQISPASPVTASSSTVPQVEPAFPPSANPVLAEQLAAAAPASAGSVMVQIASVSQQEDADVLMSALRKRGYAVASRREPLDGLIHVRIGPFKTRDEAETWRQKLLSDGYNAIVQP
jgi:cell division septation protein DedD